MKSSKAYAGSHHVHVRENNVIPTWRPLQERKQRLNLPAAQWNKSFASSQPALSSSCITQ